VPERKSIFTMKTHFEKYTLLKKLDFFIHGGEELVHERLGHFDQQEIFPNMMDSPLLEQ